MKNKRIRKFERVIEGVVFEFELGRVKYINIENKVEWISRWTFGEQGIGVKQTVQKSETVREFLPNLVKAATL